LPGRCSRTVRQPRPAESASVEMARRAVSVQKTFPSHQDTKRTSAISNLELPLPPPSGYTRCSQATNTQREPLKSQILNCLFRAPLGEGARNLNQLPPRPPAAGEGKKTRTNSLLAHRERGHRFPHRPLRGERVSRSSGTGEGSFPAFRGGSPDKRWSAPSAPPATQALPLAYLAKMRQSLRLGRMQQFFFAETRTLGNPRRVPPRSNGMPHLRIHEDSSLTKSGGGYRILSRRKLNADIPEDTVLKLAAFPRTKTKKAES